MAKIPQPAITDTINDLIEDAKEVSYPRSYMGYSGLGGPCKRAIWYTFRWVKLKETSARMVRLFERGDWEEHRLEKDLEKIGIQIHSQQKELEGLAGHVLGHIDGLLENVPGFENEVLLAEFKTANEKRFNSFRKDGVQRTEQTYYYQAQSYMGKLGLKNCLFIVTNKNTEERWMTIIEYDDLAFSKIEHVAFEVLSTDIPPERIGNSIWYQCKYCDYKQICHFGAKVLKSCRTCKNGVIEDQGKWRCDLTKLRLSLNGQKQGCDRYDPLENL